MQNSQPQCPDKGKPFNLVSDDDAKTQSCHSGMPCALKALSSTAGFVPPFAGSAGICRSLASRRLAVVTLLIFCLTSVNIGCNRPIFNRYSSLRPKTGSLHHESDTIRAQDFPATTAQQSALYQSALYQSAGNTRASENLADSANTTTVYHPAISSTAPNARLLAPQFNAGIGATPATETPSAAMPSSAAAGSQLVGHMTTDLASDSSFPGSSLPSSSGHSIGFDADSVRKFMNAQSSNPMSSGQVLNEKEPLWNNVSETKATELRDSLQNRIVETPTPAAAINSLNVPNGGNVLDSAWKVVEGPTVFEGPATLPATNQPLDIQPEPSMLDRLKEFYGPDGESSARQIWKRNIQKLQSPFNAFRDRERPVSPATMDSMEAAEPIVDSPASMLPESSSAADLLLDQLIEEVNRELNSWPQQLNGRPLNPVAYQRRSQDLQMLYLIARQPGQAVASLSSLPDGEQAFWQEMMLAMAQYREDGEGAIRERHLALTAQQLRSAAQHLSVFGDLGLKRLDICSRIHSFGRVVPFPSNEFRTGDPILLYAELENFSTDITPQGKYRTNFDAQLQVLHDNSLDAIETIELTDISDESTSERTDYFQSFELTIPSHLTPGRYRIRVRLRDRISKKTAEGFVSFDIVGK